MPSRKQLQSIVEYNEAVFFRQKEKELKRKFTYEHSVCFDNGFSKDFEPLEESRRNCLADNFSLTPKSEQQCQITVMESDTLNAAQKIQTEEKCKLLTLNMCSDRQPGGGYLNGAMAQEENIFYRSTASRMINPRDYPLAQFSAIYTPQVHVFRTDEKFEVMDEGFDIDLISMAAERSSKKNPVTMDLVENKIHALFRICQHLKYEYLLLSAWGCGAFHNNPVMVATAFKKIIPMYNFKKVYFAIKGDDLNFRTFHKIFHNCA